MSTLDYQRPDLFAPATGYPLLFQATPSAETGVERAEGAGGVTVLFVASDSIYKALGCDCYDTERNALTYRGNNPVVAHPPCQLWGKMAVVNHKRWGGEQTVAR